MTARVHGVRLTHQDAIHADATLAKGSPMTGRKAAQRVQTSVMVPAGESPLTVNIGDDVHRRLEIRVGATFAVRQEASRWAS